MRKIYIILLVLLISTSVLAQNKYNSYETPGKFGVEVTIGPSFPYGDFGRKDPYNESSGFAIVGYKAGANLSYHLIDVVDINLMGIYNSNGTNMSELENLLASKYGGAWTAESRTWSTYGGFLGFGLSYPYTKKLSVGFRAYSGILNSKAPEVKISSGNSYYKQDEKTASSFSYIISINGKYQLTRNLYWITALEFMGSSANFQDVTTTIVSGETNKVTTGSFSQDMRTFLVNTGLKLVF